MSKNDESMPGAYDAPPPYDQVKDGNQVGYPPAATQGYPNQQGYPAPPPGYTYPTQQGGVGGPGQQQAYPVQQAGYPVQYGAGQPYTQQPLTVIVQPTMMVNPPPDHMTFNVIMTLCCCWPIGIFAILKSQECRRAINRADRETADRLSRDAKRLGMWAFGVGAVLIVVMVVFMIILYSSILFQ